MNRLRQISLILIIALLVPIGAFADSVTTGGSFPGFPTISNTHVFGNATGAAAPAQDTSITTTSPALTVGSSAGALQFGLSAPGHDQSTANYTIVTTDNTQTIFCGGSFVYTLPTAGSSGFGVGWGFYIHNISASGNCTINTTTSTFLGASNTTTLLLEPGGWASIVSVTGSNWETQVGHFTQPTGSAGSFVKLAAVTANGTSSVLQFVNLPTTYNTLFLKCSGLSAAGGFKGYLGEGTGPTWETASNYTNAALFATGSGWGSSGTTTDIFAAEFGTGPNSLYLYLDSVASTTLSKLYTWSGNTFTGGAIYLVNGTGYWGADTNPITGIQLVGNGANFATGTCSLYGLVP